MATVLRLTDGIHKAARYLLWTRNRAADHHRMCAQRQTMRRHFRGFNIPFGNHRHLYRS